MRLKEAGCDGATGFEWLRSRVPWRVTVNTVNEISAPIKSVAFHVNLKNCQLLKQGLRSSVCITTFVPHQGFRKAPKSCGPNNGGVCERTILLSIQFQSKKESHMLKVA